MMFSFQDVAFVAAVSSGFLDADVNAYIAAVEAADGQALESAVRTAINSFIVGCKADNIWTAISASCILSGARTLAGALVPLRGSAPTNFNFLPPDYNRKTGLKGDGLTRSLGSGLLASALGATSHHMFVNGSEFLLGPAGDGSIFAGVWDRTRESRLIDMLDVGSARRLTRSGSFAGVEVSSSLTSSGSVAMSRTSNQSLVLYQNGSTVASFTATANPTMHNQQFAVFARNDNGVHVEHSNARLDFYSFGNGLSNVQLSALHSRIAAFKADINAAIP